MTAGTVRTTTLPAGNVKDTPALQRQPNTTVRPAPATRETNATSIASSVVATSVSQFLKKAAPAYASSGGNNVVKHVLQQAPSQRLLNEERQTSILGLDPALFLLITVCTLLLFCLVICLCVSHSTRKQRQRDAERVRRVNERARVVAAAQAAQESQRARQREEHEALQAALRASEKDFLRQKETELREEQELNTAMEASRNEFIHRRELCKKAMQQYRKDGGEHDTSSFELLVPDADEGSDNGSMAGGAGTRVLMTPVTKNVALVQPVVPASTAPDLSRSGAPLTAAAPARGASGEGVPAAYYATTGSPVVHCAPPYEEGPVPQYRPVPQLVPAPYVASPPPAMQMHSGSSSGSAELQAAYFAGTAPQMSLVSRNVAPLPSDTACRSHHTLHSMTSPSSSWGHNEMAKLEAEKQRNMYLEDRVKWLEKLVEMQMHRGNNGSGNP